ncbi:hypothetical protein GKA01_15860 [Gluconobacter kanchanaburiensis NBRC 103587]|uniref:Uncharacterized protein n=1 Tax=Gluconobacter kanchanaburiensis NBRC 103587 TaxID=1307948 RepID=A0A511B7J9_9PROT|nr:hypothetical protein GKA01_15860 [Gluconobacter kanchanaburiensis NBRC 103587]
MEQRAQESERHVRVVESVIAHSRLRHKTPGAENLSQFCDRCDAARHNRVRVQRCGIAPREDNGE